MPAGKAALLLTGTTVPDDMDVCHRCDNPPCVRPDHLFLGTDADNSRDMRRKKRHSHGARHPGARLSEEDARSILKEYSAGQTVKVLAEKFGVSTSAVSAIICGRQWKHLNAGQGRSRGKSHGDTHMSAVLNTKLVRRLRTQWAAKHFNLSEKARELKITRTSLWLAVIGRSWKHVK